MAGATITFARWADGRWADGRRAGCRWRHGFAVWRRCAVLLRALAGAPDLRLRVLVGEDALDRTIDGVYTTDLLDPRRYLTGGGDVSFAAITEKVLAARLTQSSGPGSAVARLRALAGGQVLGGAGAAVGLAAV